MWALKTWVGNFFPPKSKAKDFLALYSRRFNTVEGNTTFYATPDAATLERWRDETPPGFKFCLKFPQIISHRKRLRNCEAETREFLDRLERLGDRCGPAFLQLPPTFSGQHLDALAAYLAALPNNFRFAVEPRHADFFTREAEKRFNDLLRQYGVARCIFDTTALFALPENHSGEVSVAQGKKPNFPMRRTRTAPFAFVRFVGQPEIPNNRPWLAEWAEHVAQCLRAGDDVFFFNHNPDDTHSPMMARLFHSLVNERYGIPPLPEWGDAPEPKQASLF
ncbi:MAG: DUF72 domain-containing protein [Anaerolineales bacterium]